MQSIHNVYDDALNSLETTSTTALVNEWLSCYTNSHQYSHLHCRPPSDRTHISTPGGLCTIMNCHVYC